jgi:hypothetical protein
MSRVQQKRCAPVWRFLTLSALSACGGRTALDVSFQSETADGGGKAGASRGGAGMSSASGGKAPIAGTTSAAGTFATAGSLGLGGSGSAGEPGQSCMLSVSDCRTADQIECELSNPLCQGETDYFNRLSSLSEAHVIDVATANNGDVVLAGFYEGSLRSDSNVDSAGNPLLDTSLDVDAFVARFNNVGTALWARAVGAAGRQAATGVDVAPNGDVVVQGSSAPNSAFVARFDASGNELWRKTFGADTTEPGQVAIDNNGDTTLVGGFKGSLEYDGDGVDYEGQAVYLLRVAADGSRISLRANIPKTWQGAWAQKIVVDDEDNLILAGHGYRSDGAVAGFVQKLEPEGGTIFMKEIFGSAGHHVSSVAVDRDMRVVVGGELTGKLPLDGATLESSPPSLQNVWVAQLSSSGDLNWAQRFGSEQLEPQLGALTVDGLGNIALASDTPSAVSVRKLRPNGAEVWLRSFPTTSLGELGIAAGNDESLWLAGSFQKAFDWNGYLIGTRGQIDAFLLRLSQ